MFQPKGIIPPLITPIDGDGRINFPVMGQLIDMQLDQGVHGIFPFGTTGEFYAFDGGAYREVVEYVVRRVGGRGARFPGAGPNTPPGGGGAGHPPLPPPPPLLEGEFRPSVPSREPMGGGVGGAEAACLGGIRCVRGGDIRAKAVILTTGTALGGEIYIGKEVRPGAGDGRPPSTLLSKALLRAGFQLFRLKTGTPPRLLPSS
ncbi:MAG: dihydrodipicolinate synthase family protein, partial [Oscillospiraceae bacterium]|nr:dihydrodipicolinate synthase family protein [Oscillospiraceae bacterium]